jgi:hypothetical protein
LQFPRNTFQGEESETAVGIQFEHPAKAELQNLKKKKKKKVNHFISTFVSANSGSSPTISVKIVYSGRIDFPGRDFV